jgi:hypothetical protein
MNGANKTRPVFTRHTPGAFFFVLGTAEQLNDFASQDLHPDLYLPHSQTFGE